MKYKAIFRIYGLIIANVLLIMGGQLAYLYVVGPISMEAGKAMTLPEIPFIGLLVTILIVAGVLIIAAILQKMPPPIHYISTNKEPYCNCFFKYTTETRLEIIFKSNVSVFSNIMRKQY